MPATVGAYWGVQQSPKEMPLPVIYSTRATFFSSSPATIDPPLNLQSGDTLLFVCVIRNQAGGDDEFSYLTTIPSGLTLISDTQFGPGTGATPSLSRVYVYTKIATNSESTYSFSREGPDGPGFFNISVHAIVGAGPIEIVVPDAPAPPGTAVPAITTTKPNCLLLCAFSARSPLGPTIPRAPTTAIWYGVSPPYFGSEGGEASHWNLYERNAVTAGTYAAVSTAPGSPTGSQDQYIVMAMSPTALVAPAAPSITAVTAGDTIVTLAWDPPLNNGGAFVSDYVIQYAPNPPGTAWVTFADAVSTARTNVVYGLTNGQAYVFRIAAINAVGTGEYSPVSSAVTPTASAEFTPTDIPDLIAWHDGPIGLHVVDVGGEEGYGSLLSLVGDTIGSTTINGLTAVDFTANGGFRGAASVTGNDLTAVVLIKGIPAGNFMRLISVASPTASDSTSVGGAAVIYKHSTGFPIAWRDNSLRGSSTTPNATDPHVLMSIFDGTNHTMYTDGIAGTPVASTGTFAGTLLGVGYIGDPWETGISVSWDGEVGEVLIYDRALNSTERTNLIDYLNDKWGITPPAPTAPDAPTLVTAIPASSTTVALTWTAPVFDGLSAITDYVIEKSPNGSSSWTVVTESVSTATTYTVTGLTVDVIQYFRVKAVNAIGTGAASNVLSATPTSTTVPGTPTLTAATAGSAQVTLTWTAPASDGGSAVTDYDVEYRTTAGPGSWISFTHSGTALTSTVTGLTNGTGYDFHVRAVNAIGAGSYSATMSATPAGGALTVVYESGTAHEGSTSVAVTKPTGTAVGDFLVIGQRIFSGSATGAAPAGWTTLGPYNIEPGYARMYVHYKVATSTETAASSFAITTTGSASMGLIIMRFSGNHTTTPLNGTPATAQSYGDALAWPSVTTSVANTMIVGFFATAGSRDVSSEPSGWTYRNSIFNFIHAYTYPHASTGASPATSFAVSPGDHNGRVTIAIAPGSA